MNESRTVRDSSAVAQIGVARRDITPPVGIYNRCWGAARHDVAAGVHRPLSATVLVIRQDAAAPPLVLASIDAGWWQGDRDEWRVRGGLIEPLGLDPARVMLCLTHTHAACSLCTDDADKPGGHLIAPYLERLTAALVDATREAMQNAAPAVLTWATGRCNLAANRDLPDTDRPRIVCGYNPRHPADDTLLVARVSRIEPERASPGATAGGRCVATIVNYACHPTTLAWENELISPDFVGATREVVESVTGGAPCLFLQGASGELAPREQYVGDSTIADANGRRLGFAAAATLESMLPPATGLRYAGVVESGAPLATWARHPCEPSRLIAASQIQVELPLKKLPSETQILSELSACTDRTMAERLRRKLRVVRAVGSGPTCRLPAWIWRVGDSILLGQPNEAYSDFQIALRAALPGRAIAVMNVVNGHSGYLSPPELYDQDVYQVWQSPFERESLPRLINACQQAIGAILHQSEGTE